MWKKFVVPDSAIPTSGRSVQCGSCGNKWKQFPPNEIKKSGRINNLKKVVSKPKQVKEKKQKPKKTTSRKPREIDLYSPEYLAKKHGIKLNNDFNKSSSNNKPSSKDKVTLAFIIRYYYFY